MAFPIHQEKYLRACAASKRGRRVESCPSAGGCLLYSYTSDTCSGLLAQAPSAALWLSAHTPQTLLTNTYKKSLTYHPQHLSPKRAKPEIQGLGRAHHGLTATVTLPALMSSSCPRLVWHASRQVSGLPRSFCSSTASRLPSRPSSSCQRAGRKEGIDVSVRVGRVYL